VRDMETGEQRDARDEGEAVALLKEILG
jgi:hypothetical protein